jgi:hypothetical protein
MYPRTLRALTLVGVSLLLGAVAVVVTEPSPNQYEISIYSAYPGYFWLLVTGAMLAGALVLVGSVRRVTVGDGTVSSRAASTGDSHPRRRPTGSRASVPTSAAGTWVFGLLLMVMTSVLLLLLPLVRGYVLYGRTDPLSHVGYVRDIASSGDFGGNIYPPMHLLTMAVADATGLEVTTVGLLLPVVFSGLYFGGMYYVLLYLFDSRARILYGLPFALLPVLGRAHVGFRPYDLSLLLIPVLFYLFFKSQRTPTPYTRATFVLVLVALLLYHPLTALFLVGVFTLYYAARYVPSVQDQYATPTHFASIAAVLFVAWYSNFTSILVRFDSIYRTLFGSAEGSPPVQSYTETTERASPALIDILQTATFLYGVDLALFVLGFVFLGLALWLFVRGRYALDRYVLALSATLFVFSVGGLSFLMLDIKVPHDRPFQLAKIAGVILVGQGFYLLLHRVDWVRRRASLETTIRVALLGTLVLLVALTTLSLFPSPLGSASNPQVTEMEMAGAEWTADHGDTDNAISGVGISHRRFHHALYGTSNSSSFRIAIAPAHFNYTEHDYVGESYAADTYLTLSRQGRIVYPRVFPDYRSNWRFTPEEFARLDRDHSAARVYDSGAYDQYKVTSLVGE